MSSISSSLITGRESNNTTMAQRRMAAWKQSMASFPRSLLYLTCLALFLVTFISLRSLRPSNASSSVSSQVVRDSTTPTISSNPSNVDSSSPPPPPSSVFSKRSKSFFEDYEEMMNEFKVFIYPDGDPKTYYQTERKITGKYASEGYFFKNIRESNFITQNPDEADLFFVPVSPHKMRGLGTSYENMTVIIREYTQSLLRKYPYWNRTGGADHFFVACQDVGVRAFEGLEDMVKRSIRVVCSANYKIGYVPYKDVALPQVLQPFALPAGGNDVVNRTRLGFWAGHRNSKIRVILARVWENDTELAISNNRINRALGNLLYQKMFYTTKFCICPGGSQVNSARIADSIHYGCIPVILSDYYDLPFSYVLDWRKFSVIMKERDVYNLKAILKSISQEKFEELHHNLVKVQKHFEWHTPPIPYDAFHMVMYELWRRTSVIKYKK
ncbi:hypothetical protein LUZ60_017132 [Juncus effusus]|nr:hypothetical protein LUZ60_017132 [Juncus effusus]